VLIVAEYVNSHFYDGSRVFLILKIYDQAMPIYFFSHQYCLHQNLSQMPLLPVEEFLLLADMSLNSNWHYSIVSEYIFPYLYAQQSFFQ